MADTLKPMQQLAPQPALAVAPGAQAIVRAPAAPAPAAAPAFLITPEQQAMFNRNKAFLAEGEHSYQTQLTPEEEAQFQAYLADKSDKQDIGRQDGLDYDMRGWWKAMMAGDPKAELQVVTDSDGTLKHRNDWWKTPYHETFSGESQWAGANAPTWQGDKLVAPDGTVIYDPATAPPEQ